MIPKRLFFIWIGDTQPNYVDFCINSFKEANKKFEIEFIKYSISDIENRNIVSKYDHNVYNCIDYILSDKGTIYTKQINNNKENKRKFIQILCDILRYDVLNEYGGIYLDCDTFPIRPFDDYLLSKQNFCSYSFHAYDSIHRKRDIMFLGCDGKDKKIYNFYSIHDIFNVQKDGYLNDPIWNIKRNLFFNCLLTYREYNSEFYIEHFEDRTWIRNNCRTPLCKYDENINN